MGMAKFEFCQSHMAAFMHLGKQSARVGKEMQGGIDFAKEIATYPRSTQVDGADRTPAAAHDFGGMRT